MVFIQDFVETVRTIMAGGIVAIPTEGVWGLSCNASDLAATDRILELKNRDPTKGFIVLVNEFCDLDPWYNCLILELAKQELGRPSTWIIPVNNKCPNFLMGPNNTLAVRRVLMPSLMRIIDRTGPIVSTSANRSGRPACTARWQVQLQLGQIVDHVAKGRTQGYKKSSTIRNMQTGTIIRN